MEKNVYLLYECDEWHSKSSQVLMGIFTTKDNLLNGVRKLVRDWIENFRWNEEGCEPETADEIEERIVQEFCDTNLQTIGYVVNIMAKEAELDKVEEIY